MYPNEPITSFSQYLFAIVDSMLEQMDRLEFKKGDAQRVIVIPTHTVSSTDFNLKAQARCHQCSFFSCLIILAATRAACAVRPEGHA